jgi:RNA recognition motif-containing protein
MMPVLFGMPGMFGMPGTPGMPGMPTPGSSPFPPNDMAERREPKDKKKKKEKPEKPPREERVRPTFEPRDPSIPITELTLMLKNIPNKYKPDVLLEEFKEFRKYMDFYYLPIDFKNNCNLGYAFLNFHDVEQAEAFKNRFHDHRLPLYQQANKVLQVSEARVQGLDSYIERFKNSSVMADGVLKDEWKPLLFGPGGEIKEFPKPDGDLPALGPRFRRQR